MYVGREGETDLRFYTNYFVRNVRIRYDSLLNVSSF